MASLLVTGGAGFIGGNFVHYWNLVHPEDRVTVLDALTYAANCATLDGAHSDLIRGDIRDTALVKRLLQDRAIDTLVHFAAETHVDRSISAPNAFIETNVIGTHSLLEAARAVWLSGSGRPHRFHHVSTDEVFGSLEPSDPAFVETSPYAPNSPYSATKAASDHLVRAYGQTFGLAVTTSHCSNNYGPYQNPEKLIPRFLLAALHGRPLPIFGDGMNVRDWLHVKDHCRGIDACLSLGRPGNTYNIGGGVQLPNMTVIDMLCAEVDRAFLAVAGLAGRFPNAPAAKGEPTSSLKTFVADRAGHDRRYAINDTKARDELDYAPQHRFEEGLGETVRWYLENETWWRFLVKA